MEKILFFDLLKEIGIGYALLDHENRINFFDKIFEKFIASQKSIKDKSIFDLVDETIGLEDKFSSLIKTSNSSFSLDNINRQKDSNQISYYCIKIFSTGLDDNPILFTVQNVTEANELIRINEQQKKEIQLLASILSSNSDFLTRSILGNSKAIAAVREKVKKISAMPTTTVLLQGESGTGKSLVARVMHYSSSKNSPFVEINCAAIPENLLESELFGYEKGAFTHAVSEKAGLLEEANGGTLFLDEISELPLALQTKLLTFLETRRFRRLGSTIEKEVKIRLVTATNRNLQPLVKKGDFREDLFYRLNVVDITLPALREMNRDVLIITDHFIKVFNNEFNKAVKGITKEAEEKILSHSWPGNVRELGNCIERSIIFCDNEILSAEDILIQQFSFDELENELQIPAKGISLESLEKKYIQAALKMSDGNKSKAAQLLGLSRDTLRYRIEKHNL